MAGNWAGHFRSCLLACVLTGWELKHPFTSIAKANVLTHLCCFGRVGVDQRLGGAGAPTAGVPAAGDHGQRGGPASGHGQPQGAQRIRSDARPFARI